MRKRQYILFCLLLYGVLLIEAQQGGNPSQVSIKDTISVTPPLPDSLKVVLTDTVRPKKKPTFTDVVTYSAKDSIVLYGNGFSHLYGSSNIKYQSIDLSSDYIKLSMDSSTVFAAGRVDSLGEKIGEPVFKDGQTEYISETMRYNFNTKKGYITNVVTQQGEGYVTSARTKKMADDELCMQGGRYTTCDNHDHPHFYLQMTQAKIKQGSHIVAGPAYMVMADVPLPLFVPFGYFPFNTTYSSGIIMPTFGDEMQRGFYLRNGGYYFAINEYVDAALTGEIYTKGSWGLNLQSNYAWRYHFGGSLSASYIETVNSEKGLSDYSKNQDFRVSWTHTQDAKSNPAISFSASVNFSTSSYDRNNVDSYYDPNRFTQNTKSSSISFGYRPPNSVFSLSAGFNLSQRTSDSTLSVSLPDLTLSVSSIYPFKRKNPVGKQRWYEKISFSYTGIFRNSTEIKENKIFTTPYLEGWKVGMQHTIPVSASFNLFKYINITPSVSYTERWYTNATHRGWDYNKNQEVATDTTYSFYRVFNFSGSISASTKLYGFYKSLPFLGDWTVRHMFTPTVSLSATPDFSDKIFGFYDSYTYVDRNNQTRKVVYSPFQNNMFGTAPRGTQANVNMSIANNIELKYKVKNDTIDEYRKLSLIDNLSLSSSYNMAADSLRWSDIGANIRIKLVKEFTLNLNMSFDPYAYTYDTGINRVVKLNSSQLEKYGRILQLKSASTSFSYTFNNATFEKKNKKTSAKNEEPDPVDPLAPESEQKDPKDTGESGAASLRKKKEKRETDRDGYEPFKIPWSLSLNYSLNYGYADFNKAKSEYNLKLTHNLGISGSIALTKTWNFNFSTNYNIDRNELSQMTLNISKDLHCWQMSASVVPFGPYASYTFNIAVKSSLLKDIKWDQRSERTTPVDWK